MKYRELKDAIKVGLAWSAIATGIELVMLTVGLTVGLFDSVLKENSSYTRLLVTREEYFQRVLIKAETVIGLQSNIIKAQNTEIRQLVSSRCFDRAITAGKVSIKRHRGIVFTAKK